MTDQTSTALRVFYSGTVVSNGGDAAIHLAQHQTLVDTFGEIDATMADSAPVIAAELFPDTRQVAPVWPYTKRGQWRYPRLTTAWRRLLTARILAAARTPRGFGERLLTVAERATIAAIRQADLVIYSGGTTLIEKYDIEPKMLELRIAASLGKPLVLMPASLGPFSSKLNRRRMRRLLDDATLVICRDDLSKGHLDDILPDSANVTVAPDIVFAMTRPNAVDRLRETAQLRRAIISVRDIRLFAANQAAVNQYVDAMAAVATALVEIDGVSVTFLSTCQGIESYALDDSAVAVDVAGRLSPEVRAKVTVDRHRHTPAEIQQAFAEVDLVIATRMHAAILAITAGTPVLPIAYEFKTHEVFTQLGVGQLVLDADAITGPDVVAARHKPLAADMRGAVADGLTTMLDRMADIRHSIVAATDVGSPAP